MESLVLNTNFFKKPQLPLTLILYRLILVTSLATVISWHLSHMQVYVRYFVCNRFVRSWFSEWQKTVNPDLFRKSAIESLTYACQHHWNDQKSITSNPSHLVKELGLTEKQLQWSTVKGRAAKKSWDDIENLIITKV